jgi:toxin ParE1/3/4
VKVFLSDEARRRLREIRAFVAEDNAVAADRLVERLLRRAESLATMPHRGRRAPELPESDVREVIDGNYRIVYRIGSDRVVVLTVFEAHRLLRRGEVE